MEPLVRVDDDFEDEYPGASALATECFVNLWRASDALMELITSITLGEHKLSQSALQVLAVVDGAGQPLEPSVIAERLLVTTGSMTSLLDNLEKRQLIVRQPHPDDRRKLLIDITQEGPGVVDELLPALHAREREVVDLALSPTEQRSLLKLITKLQHAALEVRSTPTPQGAVRRRRPTTPKGSRS